MKNVWPFRLVATLVTGLLYHSATAQISVSLPGLTGDYCSGWFQPPSVPSQRQTTFTIPPEITSVETLRLRISGNCTAGLLTCSNPYGGGPPGFAPFSPALSLFLHAGTLASNDFFHASVDPLPEGGSLDGLVATFEWCCPPGSANPNLLLGTEISAEFFVDWMLLPTCNVLADAHYTVTSVQLVIAGTVPVSSRSWSGIKALYR